MKYKINSRIFLNFLSEIYSVKSYFDSFPANYTYVRMYV